MKPTILSAGPSVHIVADYQASSSSTRNTDPFPSAHLVTSDVPTVPKRFISYSEAVKRTALSRSTLYVYIERGLFPKPYRVGLRAVRFLSSEIEAWCETRSHVGIG